MGKIFYYKWTYVTTIFCVTANIWNKKVSHITQYSFFPCNDYNTMDPSSLQTLRRVEENDATFTELYIGGMEITSFNSSNSRDFSHLGASIAQNTNVKTLSFNFVHNLDAMNNEFFDGLKYNSSIDELILNCDDRGIVGGVIQELLEVYQENSNLTNLCIRHSILHNGGDQIVATTLRRCTNLVELSLYGCNISNQQLTLIIEAVRGHRKLSSVSLDSNGISNAGCDVLANFLIDPNCNLLHLDLGGRNDIDNDGVSTLANSLSNNTTMKQLYLRGNPIDRRVDEVFSKVLCNTSNIDSIYSSNHTLEGLILGHPKGGLLDSVLKMNRDTNKSHVAIKKILKYHPNMNMEPLFEWNMEGEGERDLKALPYVIAWFGRAQDAVAGGGGGERYNIDARKLSAIYQFAKAMPLMFVPTSHIRGQKET